MDRKLIHDNLLTCILCRGANNNVTLCTANVQLTCICCLKSTSYPRFIELCLRTFNFEVTATEIMYAWKGQELAASSQINYRCFSFRSLTCSNRPCFFFSFVHLYQLFGTIYLRVFCKAIRTLGALCFPFRCALYFSYGEIPFNWNSSWLWLIFVCNVNPTEVAGIWQLKQCTLS